MGYLLKCVVNEEKYIIKQDLNNYNTYSCKYSITWSGVANIYAPNATLC